MSVRAKLIASFAAVVFLTVLVGGTGLYAFRQIDVVFRDIVAVKLPEITLAQNLASQGQTVVSTAPLMLSAETEEQRSEIYSSLRSGLDGLFETTNELRNRLGEQEQITQIDTASHELEAAIDAMNNALGVLITTRASMQEKLGILDQTSKDYQQTVDVILRTLTMGRQGVAVQTNKIRKDAEKDPTVVAANAEKLAELLFAMNTASENEEPARQIKELGEKIHALLTQTAVESDLAKFDSLSTRAKIILGKIPSFLRSQNDRVKETYNGYIQNYAELSAGDDSIGSLRLRILSSEAELATQFATARQIAEKLNVATANLLANAEAEIGQSEATATTTIGTMSTVIWAAIGASIVVSGILFWLIVVRNLLFRLSRLQGCMEQLSEGDLDVSIPTGASDELGAMADTVEIFRDNALQVKKLEESQREQAAHAEQEKRAMMNKLADDFQAQVGDLLEAVGKAIAEMRNEANAMLGTAEHTNTQAASVSAASSLASENVQAVATAADQLSASITEISQQVSHAASTTSEAVAESERSNRMVQELAESANRIGEVVQLISDIAEQTNLLALNATIEAARAGDAGKGFAVVANEVKSLASQTARATDEIGQQMDAIQRATSGAVESIRSIGSVISRINEISGGISAAVEEQGAATNEIAGNVQQAASGTDKVNASIGDVTAAAETTGQSAKHVLEAVQRVDSQAEALRNQVNLFVEKIRAS